MGPDLSHVASSASFSRILLAENDLSTYDPLIRTFGDRRLDVDIDVCTSHRDAVRQLLGSPYQLIISGANLAEMEDFLLVKRTQSLDTFVPLVVTASASEKESACRVLEHGAFDLITCPFDHEQTGSTILLALWQSKLKTLIATKERTLEKDREHIPAYPRGNQMDPTFKRTLSAIERSIVSYQQCILRIEGFADLAAIVEIQARKRALERLNAMSDSPMA